MDVFFKIGDRIELTHTVSALNRALSKNVYSSQLLDFDDVRTAKLSMPIHEGKIIPLETGDEYQLCFYTQSGLYRCRGRVEKRYNENNMYVMDVLLLSELRKFQRRQYYRLDCVVELKYRILSEEEIRLRKILHERRVDSPEQEQQFYELLDRIVKDWEDGTAADLSGGGVRFHCNRELPLGTVLEVSVPLDFQNGIVPVNFTARVLSCQNLENMHTFFEIRGEFVGITDTEREIIIQYVFEEQRRRMRKE